MHVLSTLLLASSTATLVTASPINQQGKRPGAAVISLPARSTTHHNDSERVFNAEAARRERSRVLAKYAGKNFTPVAARNATITKRSILGGAKRAPFDVHDRRASSGTEPLMPFIKTNLVSYYGPLYVGTPTQVTGVIFDTGLGDLVLPLSSCSNCPGPTFQNESSSTFTSSSTPFFIEYADGSSAAGTVATDTVTVAGLTVSQQSFGAVTQETGNLLSAVNAGFLGLGFPDNAKSGATPFFINLAESESLASNVFSFYIARNNLENGELCIGCINSAMYTESLLYYDIDPSATGGKQYYWNIPCGGLFYDGQPAGSSFSASIDSGTSLIYVPTAVATALYAQIPGAQPAPEDFEPGSYTIPCDSTPSPITLKFSDHPYAINPYDFILGPFQSGYCIGGIVGLDTVDGIAIIGDVFMTNWYSVFDYENRKVGFAQAVQN